MSRASAPRYSAAARLLALLLFVTGLACASGEASAQTLQGDALKSLVSGRTIYLNTPIGEVPVRYAVDGTMSAQAPGAVILIGTDRDKGQWWIAKDRFCQKWDNWFSGRTNCVTITRVGNTFTWQREDGRTGTGRIAAR